MAGENPGFFSRKGIMPTSLYPVSRTQHKRRLSQKSKSKQKGGNGDGPDCVKVSGDAATLEATKQLLEEKCEIARKKVSDCNAVHSLPRNPMTSSRIIACEKNRPTFEEEVKCNCVSGMTQVTKHEIMNSVSSGGGRRRSAKRVSQKKRVSRRKSQRRM
jgi:hypothetical protein